MKKLIFLLLINSKCIIICYTLFWQKSAMSTNKTQCFLLEKVNECLDVMNLTRAQKTFIRRSALDNFMGDNSWRIPFVGGLTISKEDFCRCRGWQCCKDHPNMCLCSTDLKGSAQTCTHCNVLLQRQKEKKDEGIYDYCLALRRFLKWTIIKEFQKGNAHATEHVKILVEEFFQEHCRDMAITKTLRKSFQTAAMQFMTEYDEPIPVGCFVYECCGCGSFCKICVASSEKRERETDMHLTNFECRLEVVLRDFQKLC